MGTAQRGWGVTSVLIDVVRVIRARPLRALLLLGVVPALWDLPTWYFREPDQLARAGVGVLAAELAWQSVIAGGVVQAAINLATGCETGLSTLVKGVRFAPQLFIARAAPAAAMLLFGPMEHLERDAGGMLLASLLVVLVLFLVMIRGVAWEPCIVDRRESVLGAFRTSWHATRGASGRIIVLVLLVAAAHGLVGLALLSRPPLLRALSALLSVPTSLVLAVLYLRLLPRSEALVGSDVDGAAPANDGAGAAKETLPVDGSGWVRDTKRGR